MNFKHEKYVRFENSSSEKSVGDEKHVSSDRGLTRTRLSVSSVVGTIRRGLEKSSKGIASMKNSPNVRSTSDQSKKELGPWKKILDPQGLFLQQWNKIFLLVCLISLYLDPLFFYIPVFVGKNRCLDLDNQLKILACVLRSFTDIFYILHIIFQFRTGFIAPSSRVFETGVLVENPYAIAKRYLSTYFIIDILAILPLPQVVVLVISPNGNARTIKDMLDNVILLQYLPRLIRICPLYKELRRSSGIFTLKAWPIAVYNFFYCMLYSHFFGALWYSFAIERKDKCWRDACSRDNDHCDVQFLYCGKDHDQNNEFLSNSCPLLEPNEIKNSTDFYFGIYLDALRFNVVEMTDFPKKILYCFWWGFRSLSSLGQNLNTSTSVGEIVFSLLISVYGYGLLTVLIGSNMQKLVQSIAVRLEEARIKRQDAELWMSRRMLPEDLRQRIRRYEHYKWQETRGVDEELLLRNLPKDLRRDIKRHLCWALLNRVPMFENMDEQLLDAMCDRLKPVLYTENSYIVREGDSVDEMLFVMRGKMLTVTTNGGRIGFFNSAYLKAGDFCGEELLTWALDPNSSSSLPISTRTVQSLSDVEAFALMADDLKSVASQFRRLHSRQLQHSFRFHSQQWRSWAACLIQAAWRRYGRRKVEKSLCEEEDRLQNALAKEGGTSPSLGATIYASRFVANALRTLRHNHAPGAKLPYKIPPFPLQKPIEPDFSAEDHN